MSTPPARPKIYHITHVDNLAAIAAEGQLVCDRTMIARGGPAKAIGMSDIKRRRVEELEVDCHQGTKVGDYVPFYFCPRSIMLYLLYRGNHENLTYREGQGPIVHLEADLHTVIAWAEQEQRRWAFSLSNAGARYTEFRKNPAQLSQLDWNAIDASDFRASAVAHAKQAEFLLCDSFPLELVERVGVSSTRVAQAVGRLFPSGTPPIKVKPDWYF